MEPRLLMFWALAATAAALAGLVVTAFAARGARRGAIDDDPAVTTLRRQYAEIDALAERGLLAPEETRTARAEAGRRLLAEADRAKMPWNAGGRRATVLAAGAAGIAALALYLLLGSPALPDQPYAKRLATWRATDPAALQPAEMAAVLADVARARPSDPQVFDYLGQARMAAGDAIGAGQAFAKAAELAPRRADLHVRLAAALWAQAEAPSPPALSALRRALQIDPGNVDARFLLAQADMEQGRREAGLAAMRALVEELPAGDPRREAVRQAMTPPVAVPPDEAGQQAMIRGMVEGLAARLAEAPDDPEGWGRLVRAYTVLGDQAALEAALARVRTLYAGRPEVVARIEAAARAPAAAP